MAALASLRIDQPAVMDQEGDNPAATLTETHSSEVERRSGEVARRPRVSSFAKVQKVPKFLEAARGVPKLKWYS